jgi:hypothetical protein
MPRAEHIGERLVHFIPELPCAYGRKLGRAFFHEPGEGVVDEITLLVISKWRLMDHYERLKAGVQSSLKVALPLEAVCWVIPEGPIQRVADMADREISDMRDTLLIEAMNPNADRGSVKERRRESKTDGRQAEPFGQP